MHSYGAFPIEGKMLYPLLEKQMAALLEGEKNKIANLANASALLWQGLREINWAGFYLLQGEELVLGPFQGKPACIRIPVGRGVCGTAASTKETQLVTDVHAFPGHIACDEASKSEIVIPLFAGERLVGVLDIDSPKQARFNAEDQQGLEAFAKVLTEGCEW